VPPAYRKPQQDDWDWTASRRYEMPYKDTKDLPDSVRDNLPKHAQEIYLKAYNSALEEYKDPDKRRGSESHEETAAKVAWAAVKHEYEKDEKSGEWKPKHRARA
jgi:cation transport regulator